MKKKVNLPVIIIVGVIVGFAIIMIRFNTGIANDIFEHPQKGDFYVVKNFPDATAGEFIFKISDVGKDSITFQISNSKLINGFQINQSESYVRTNSNSMFGEYEVSISHKDLKKMNDDGTFNGGMDAKPYIYHVFR